MSLRDSLAADVTVGYDYAFLNGVPCDGPIADAIIRSPEMQNIRITLQAMAMRLAVRDSVERRDVLVSMGALPNVIEWVLS